MTARHDSRSRARTRAGTRPVRRFPHCRRHPGEPTAGICASCLRERLSGLDPAAAVNNPDASPPELRRCRSVAAVSKCEGSSGGRSEPRRRSCDVVSARSPLCSLFDVDDLRSGSESEARVESKNVGRNAGLSKVTYTVIEPEKDNHNGSEIRVSSHELGETSADSDGDIRGGEFKTMKEHIDLEFHKKTKKSKDLREKIAGATSVFARRLLNWRQNNTNKAKNQKNNIHAGKKLEGPPNPAILGRRSCDTNPRLSVDASKISFEEPRASWDGYMIARTIPRLAPMFSLVENGIFEGPNKFESHRLSMDRPMHSIVEDESMSGASASGHSNSDSSSSMRRSSFDRSSSARSFGKKPSGSEDHENVKLVITEKELKDWHLSNGLEKNGPVFSGDENIVAANIEYAGPTKKSIRWRKVCNVFGFGPKRGSDGLHMGNGVPKLARSASVVGPRKSCDAVVVESNYRRRSVDGACGGYGLQGIEGFKLERVSGGKYCSGVEIGDGNNMPFYMTPLRSLKHSKSGKFRVQNLHGPVC
ncbi:hypothetical protein STAS_03852 [Striga asiatica]|uniref:Uncharacterized protein n=1 Tax=Striga asiatica TaxID=4170 RepID=A0A5A7P5L7_STRAF|nr:hypothetical protein STAS_03852 [Striga asiatica]